VYKGFTKMDISELFTVDSNVKGHTLKLENLGCLRDSTHIRKFFSHRVVGPGIVWIKKWWMHLVSMPSRGDLIK